MTETTHTRSRRAALAGLLLQVVGFATVLVLSKVAAVSALWALAWYMAGGILIWFAAVLVFRQSELAALEAMDLAELRRERRTAGGAEAIFDEESGAFRVAGARLEWMRRWLIPGFALLHTLYLAGMGAFLWFTLTSLNDPAQPATDNLPIILIVLAVLMLLFFLFSRFASGLGRVPEWQLLRACGSYMLGNALAILAAIVCLGIFLYVHEDRPDTALTALLPARMLARVLAVVMVVLAAETLVSFVLDIYRPRSPGSAPRAAFDSRLLALISEPGGIASTIAEAINYQFGFEVSQTWFYQLLQRAAVPLLGVGALILWLTTCVLIVQPNEHAIVERFGRQLNAAEPYAAGTYFKLPWPIDVARTYDTGRLHQINVGFEVFDAQAEGEEEATVALWSDEKHWQQRHFDFLIPAPGLGRLGAFGLPLLGLARLTQAPVNLVRMDVIVQYKLQPERLADYTQQAVDGQADRGAHAALLDIAWDEVVRYAASSTIFALLEEKSARAGLELRERIARRVDALRLGLEIVYVGVQNVHPEPNVAKEFRKVVSADQERIASIRRALVEENEILSAVVGDRDTARELMNAIEPLVPNQTRLDEAQSGLARAPSERVAPFRERLKELAPLFAAAVEARWAADEARALEFGLQRDIELGLGQSVEELAQAAERTRAAEEAVQKAEAALAEPLEPLIRAAAAQLGPATAEALREYAQADFTLRFWNRRLDELLPRLQGQAAAVLAQARADRWTYELGAAEELARIRGEREAYAAAPQVYKVRKHLEVLVEGLRDARKYFLAFDPGERTVRVRFEAQEQSRPDIGQIQTRIPEK